uniref:Uncharacterized protein n=1 Tax=Oryza rufipogon TaxID=4529 RepID=A0A0E0P347_ORYRU
MRATGPRFQRRRSTMWKRRGGRGGKGGGGRRRWLRGGRGDPAPGDAAPGDEAVAGAPSPSSSSATQRSPTTHAHGRCTPTSFPPRYASPGPSSPPPTLRRAAAGVSVLDLARTTSPSPSPTSPPPPMPTPSLLPRHRPRRCRRHGAALLSRLAPTGRPSQRQRSVRKRRGEREGGRERRLMWIV